MIQITQTVELPKDLTFTGGEIVASGRIGLFAMNRLRELLAVAAKELEDALGG